MEFKPTEQERERATELVRTNRLKYPGWENLTEEQFEQEVITMARIGRVHRLQEEAYQKQERKKEAFQRRICWVTLAISIAALIMSFAKG